MATFRPTEEGKVLSLSQIMLKKQATKVQNPFDDVVFFRDT